MLEVLGGEVLIRRSLLCLIVTGSVYRDDIGLDGSSASLIVPLVSFSVRFDLKKSAVTPHPSVCVITESTSVKKLMG